jgi:hypothetical protein
LTEKARSVEGFYTIENAPDRLQVAWETWESGTLSKMPGQDEPLYKEFDTSLNVI